MNKATLALFLVILCAVPVSASSVVLPDNGTYYYWLRGGAGSLSTPPHKVSGTDKLIIPNAKAMDATLFVLDPHTGGVAATTLGNNPEVTLTIDEFHVPATVAPTNSSSPSSLSELAATPPPAHPSQSQFSKIITSILSLALLAGVIWFVRSLYLTRGQILIDAARKAGVDVPNPGDPVPGAVAVDGKYEPPPPPKVERIPDKAFKSAPTASKYGYLITADGTSFPVGKKPITIGRDDSNEIVLHDPSVSRQHALVEIVDGSVQITDQGSANGIHINGEQIYSAELTQGTSLTIGQVPLRYEG